MTCGPNLQHSCKMGEHLDAFLAVNRSIDRAQAQFSGKLRSTRYLPNLPGLLPRRFLLTRGCAEIIRIGVEIRGR